MAGPFQLKRDWLLLSIPLGLLLILTLLLQSQWYTTFDKHMSTYVTIDFLVTIPLIYAFLVRKRAKLKFTIVPFVVLCVVLASYVIPESQQSLLDFVKHWIIPFIELGVLMVILIKIRKAMAHYRTLNVEGRDYHSILLETCQSVLPELPARLMASELALLYYGFFNFKRTKLQSHEFSNYKGSGILSTLGALMVVVGFEMVTLHILMMTWQPVVAWILTVLSFYSALQLFGIIRSIPKRPIVIHKDQLLLHFGILTETRIPLDAIDRVELANYSDKEKNDQTRSLSLLGGLEQPNVLLHLKSAQKLHFLYGSPKTYQKLWLFVDTPDRFKAQLEAKS